MAFQQFAHYVLGVLLAGIVLYFAWSAFRFLRALVPIIREHRALARLTDTRDLAARVDREGEDYVRGRAYAILTIGVLHRGRRYVCSYGPLDGTPAGERIYEIGSITKVFTGALLACLEAEGSVVLDDPIGKFLPADLHPPKEIAAITLKQLATHTSGLPRLPGNFDATAKNDADPYVNYGTVELYAALRSGRLERPAGKKSVYSNFGVGLLGHLLTSHCGETLEAAIGRRICTPLGLADTVQTLKNAQEGRLVYGHAPTGEPTMRWNFAALAGAGALVSTADDLLKFIEANLSERDDLLGRALARSRETLFRSWLGSNQGLGWQIDDDTANQRVLHWHNGGTGGFVSFLGLDHARKLGVVVLSNCGDALIGDERVDRIGFRLLKTAAKVSLA